MRRSDRIKLNFIRNWNLPGKERLSNWFKPSGGLKQNISGGIVWLNNEDIAIYTNGDSYIEWTIMSGGTYEDEIGKLIKISLKEGDNCLDIGGNIGLQSIRMAKCLGDSGRVYAFEPLQYLQEKFKRNTALNKADNIALLPFALSDTESEAQFSIDKNAWNQGTFSLGGSNGGDTQAVIIKVADNLPEVKSLPHLALIKIDVEGFEYQVLRGLAATLKTHKPRIIFEYDEKYWARNGQNITDCHAFLTGLGYTLYQIYPFGCTLIKDVASIEGGNIFCVVE